MQNEAEYESDSSESSDEDIIIVEEEDMSDINDDTPIEITIQNDETNVEYLVEHTTEMVGKDNE